MASLITRRHVLAGSTALAAGAAGYAYFSQTTPWAADRAAKSEHDLYDRGLVPIERSGWTQPQGLADKFPSLEASIDVDCLVIGAGLAGASLALHLAEAGIKVAVLDARQPGWGASGRNAGHVLPVMADIGVIDAFPDRGKGFREAIRQHHTIPFDLAAKHGIDCDAVRAGYLNAMTSQDAFEGFLDKFAYVERDGFQKVQQLRDGEMAEMTGSHHFTHGVMFENGGRINPYLFTNGMIAAAVKMGAIIHGDSEALNLAREGKRWRVRTAKGDVVASRVVFCTAAYPTAIIPAFETCFYPLTAYALTTKPLPLDIQSRIMPGGATLAQAPMDLNPLVKDRHGRLILSSLPSSRAPEDARWHFENQIAWLHKVWPETEGAKIELDQYWTGRVALRQREFPGAYDMGDGIYGLMHFNAWGNVMAPLMGMLLAEGLAKDRTETLPFPLGKPEPVSYQPKQELLLRRTLIPAARFGQQLDII